MKFITLVKGPEGMEPPQSLFGAIDDLMKEAGDTLIWAGGFNNTKTAAMAKADGRKVRVMDGPFTEAKELIGGFAIYEVATRAEAVEWVRKFVDAHIKHWPEWPVEVELREIAEAFPFRT